MLKYNFFDDYSEGAHQNVLNFFNQGNLDQHLGYGNDSLTIKASEIIRKIIENPGADIHFVASGTQANIVCLAAMLRPFESVIAADTGHINVHEAGAIEALGHKINAVKSSDGKLTPDKIQSVVDLHSDEHMVKPRAVFISNATEVGTIYKKFELEQLAVCCRKNNLYLYLDGARLGSALCSRRSDLTLPDLTRLVDVFYIGGTKNGAFLGEAIAINNKHLQSNFRFHLKQRGALLAKGRVIAAQFIALFSDNLYFDLASHANKMAFMLSEGLEKLGIKFTAPVTTNQIFPILDNKIIDSLKKEYGFYLWSKVDHQYSIIRLVTSWATPEEKIREFISDISKHF